MISRKMLANSAAQILFCKPADDFRLDFQRELHHVLAQPVVVWSRGHQQPNLRGRHIIFDKPIIYETGRLLGKIESVNNK